MSFYTRYVLPWLLDFSMRQSNFVGYRQAIVSQASGTVVEVGIGSGLNLPMYGASVSRVVGVDPWPESLAMAKKRLKDTPLPIELLRASAEELPLSSHFADAVVLTWTLCTIPDPLKALVEMRLVLKPGGLLLFVEHGLAPEPKTQKWQNRLTPCWRRMSGGCHLNRKIDDLIRAGGFRINELHTGYAKGPKATGFMYDGLAASPR